MKYRDAATGEEKTFVLPPELKTRWLTALRSGDYKQTSGALFSQAKNGYCCLGVLCKIEGRLKATKVGSTLYATNFYVDKERKGSPAAWVAEDLVPKPIQDRLAEYNDGGKSFTWIAAYIERYL